MRARASLSFFGLDKGVFGVSIFHGHPIQATKSNLCVGSRTQSPTLFILSWALESIKPLWLSGGTPDRTGKLDWTGIFPIFSLTGSVLYMCVYARINI